MYSELVDRLRCAVNRDPLFLSSQNWESNNWNIICSCMDWLTHAASQLDEDYPSKLLGTNDSFMYIVPYIAYIDLFLEAFLQLRRCIMGLDYKNNFYKENNDHFKNSYYNDFGNKKYLISTLHKNNSYDTFVHIRALLAMHPINLKIDEKRYYASWTRIENRNIKLALWSNDDDNINTASVSIEDLDKFLKDIVSQIEGLILKIPNVIEKHKNYFINIDIDNTNSWEEEIDLLMVESQKRFGDYLLREYLEDYKKILLLDSDDYIVNIYQDHINSLLYTMRKEIQSMEISSDFSCAISMDNYEGNLRYVLQKVYYGGIHHYATIEDELRIFLKDVGEIPTYANFNDEERIKIWAMLHYKIINI